MAYPRFRRSRAHKLVSRATGTSIVLNSTAIAEVAAATNGPGTGGFDITLEAQVNDVLEVGINALFGNEAVQVCFDIYTIVSSARTNPFGAGLSASNGTTQGLQSWIGFSGSFTGIGTPALYVVQAGDIASGAVTIRPYYVTTTATNKTLFSTANNPFKMYCKNLGPVSV